MPAGIVEELGGTTAIQDEMRCSQFGAQNLVPFRDKLLHVPLDPLLPVVPPLPYVPRTQIDGLLHHHNEIGGLLGVGEELQLAAPILRPVANGSSPL